MNYLSGSEFQKSFTEIIYKIQEYSIQKSLTGYMNYL